VYLSEDFSENNTFFYSQRFNSGQFWIAGFLFCRLVKVDSTFFGGGNFSFVRKGIRLPNSFLISALDHRRLALPAIQGRF